MEANQTTELLARYRSEMQEELSNILEYWSRYVVDDVNGGFIGKVNDDNEADHDAPKGSVLNSRILWTYSAAFNLTGNNDWLELATRAYQYIKDHFIDKEYGGVFWTVDHKGYPLDTKKQIYALSFTVYGLSEYYKASKNGEALLLAIELYRAIFEHSYDNQYGGYIEALTRDWRAIEDLRLSDRDANEKKSMNTHLHVIEGFANLYSVWPDATLKSRIEELIHIFLEHILDLKTFHLQLFFDEEWRSKYNMVSYGHDIEAAWLIQESAETIHHEELLKKVREYSIKIADAASEGLDKDGGLWYEYNTDSDHLVKEKHWWPQAEAMVGFYNTYQLTGNSDWLMRSYNSWNFVKEYILNKEKGEWYWGINPDHSIMQGQDKAGLWKCPYHNGRACIEIISRIG